MNVYLYQPDGEQDNDIKFYMPHATNGVIVYLFKSGAGTAPNKTLLVSGYENSRPISMQLAMGARKDAFVLSCVRAPCLFRELFVYNKYTAPLGLVIVRAGRAAPEAWHVLSVRRRAEAKRTQKIKGLRVHNNSGPDQFYPKTLMSLAGNVPSHFMNNLQNCRTRHQDVGVLNLLCPDLHINDSPVQLEETIATSAID
ncbi:unknown [Choristoneura fumiferana multiple nucleopolyhedrovirus]|uniref:Uncharacterized protein n=1 Tax=Choristoneura fumiferana nuclear polyhedrosis virus TaxID=208973 RepID=Q7TLM2_NPVCF|nr:unknown [Choristoneura fumiferana multiple nucleopolyhedrovirus]AAP29914.1 unknown [Choristoneura fumiferana multiple nucleopolyhedrovirus]